MNTAPIKRTLSVTGLLMTGAACGMGAVKVLTPQWLAPAAVETYTAAEDEPASRTASASVGPRESSLTHSQVADSNPSE